MTQPARSSRRRVAVATAAAAGIAAIPAALSILPADAADGPAATPKFQRVNIDTAISGASFTSVGEVFAGEQNIVTSGYGPLDAPGRPTGGGSLQIYRPGASLADWTKVSVFGPSENIVFPNATSIEDVDGDGDNDIIVPSGYFFGTDPAAPAPLHTSGAITWWENKGANAAFVRHDVVTGQAGSYHGVQLVDLDDDGIKDLLSVSEEAKVSGDQTNDVVHTHFFKGTADGGFGSPVDLAGVGGSQPVVNDVDEDGDLDIISSQYFNVMDSTTGAGTFLWLENVDTDGALSAADFTLHNIATLTDVGMGFQIRPVPDFREPGEVSWIGTNHVNRCTFALLFPGFAWPEQVIEFTPGADLTQPWTRTSLSEPSTPAEPCPSDYSNREKYPVHSSAITSRYGPGQGAPGVFGYGDIDGDQDVDLLVSGDGDRRLWWVENEADGSTTLHQLTEPGEYFGQAGGAVVANMNGTGGNELVFSSFDTNTLAIWTRDPMPTPSPSTSPTPSPSASPSATPTTNPATTVRSTLRISPAKRSVKAGAKVRFAVRLKSAATGARRTVTVVFDPARGKTVKLGKLSLRKTGAAGVHQGRIVYRPKQKGQIVVRYAGTKHSPTLRDTAARGSARVVIR